MPTSTEAPAAERPVAAPTKPAIPGGDKFHRYPFWAPRFWHGMTTGVWLRLVGRNRFRISFLRLGLFCTVTTVSLINTFLWLVQKLIFGRRIERIPLKHAPIFIVGHWRSGTTYLHELMVLDDRFSYPTTYQCFAPSHFLVSNWFVTHFMNFLLPSKRPMDNMATGWRLPQEDEFALCNLGLGSPYFTMAFPNQPPQGEEYLDLKELSDAERERWKEVMLSFLKHVAYHQPDKPIVLKSPPHTARVRTLLELFPQAKFVHIVRDPYVVFLSTVRLWRSLYQVQGLQIDDGHDVSEHVLAAFERMYRSLEEDRELLPPSQFYEVRYEDLVRDPVGQLQSMYEQLNLGDFEHVRPNLAAQVQRSKDYKTNKYEISDDAKQLVDDRWGDFARRYGYR
jgi:omega-hydroxy-beta-dihydromenaquinone-9 sulfotransferase